MSATTLTELRWLEPAALTFALNGVHLRLTIESECSFPIVTIARSFPLTDPDRWLSVRAGNKEVGLIGDISQLGEANRTLVSAWLAQRYLVPRISRIHDIEERFETLEWDVDTDRGRCRFTTRELRDNVTTPAAGRHIVSDVDGNRFDIVHHEIDAYSRRKLHRYL